MSVYIDVHFIRCLKRNPDERTQDDLQCIFAHLHDLEALRSLREPAIREIAKTVRYERHEANDILYCRDDLSTCWFILLSGSVFIDHAMYLPRSSFGKRTSGSGRRGTDCLILEPSELLVLLHPGQRQSCTPTNLERLMALEQDEVKVSANHRGRSLSEDRSHEDDHEPLPSIRLERALSVGSEKKYNKKDLDDVQIIMDNNPDSHPRHLMALSAHNTPTHTVSSGDRSSMHSSMSSSYSDIYSAAENQDLDLSGLVESTVDSDEEESSESGSLLVRDLVRDCLEKDPMHRTEDEIELLLDFMRHLPAFANMTMSVRRALCSVMVFAVVSKAGTVVMKDGEELDSWSVILNGHVEVSKPDESVDELHLGDSFGVKPTMEKQNHSGVMRTTVDDCQFVCIAQEHYYRILTQGEENIRRISEDGVLVMVTEHRVLDERRFGHVVIKATPDRLVSHLIANHSPIDPTYVEDFLMTYRTYMDSPHQICSCLLHWFHDIEMRDKVTRVVLLWVNNYYNDFESNFDMIEFLEEFEDNLEKENMTGQLRLLHIAGAAKAKPRTVILARSDRESSLAFSIVGGWEKKMGIFISKVDKGSKAQKVGLRKGDQIQEVNGHNFEHVTNEKAEKILKGTTHLSIIVKYNTLAFRDLLASQDSRPGSTGRRASQEIALLQSDPLARLGLPDMPMSFTGPEIKDKSKLDKKGAFGKNKAKLMRTMAKLSILPNKPNAKDDNVSAGLMRSGRANSLAGNPYLSNSNPDLSSLPSVSYFDGGGGGYGYNDFPEHVLKIYKADQSCKYFLVHKETTANEVTMLSMREFNVTEPACTGKYSLCEVTVGQGGLVKQKRLPDHQANIASKLSLNGRLFLKNNMASETLMPDEVAVELLKESQVNFLQLDSVEVAVQFSLRDYAIFEAIEPTDYIEDLFSLKPQGKKDIDRLKAYEELVNLEMFWVISEVVSEPSIMKRAKILKNFIKIARHFKDCHNFNSLFAVISGLGHGSVSRLRLAWDKVPSKYIKMFEDLQALLDPSRNMSKYRNLINAENVQPPLMPFFPIVKKDLTFIHLGNDSYVEGLINFEKQRMVAREVRYFHSMGNAPYDPKHLLTPVQTQGNSYGFSVVSGTATLPRKRNQNRRNSGLLNPKKMWEEAQMSRRVKMYMANLTVIQDEDQLRDMSLRCEPVASSGGSSSNSGSYATLPRRTHHNSASNVSQSSLDPSDTASISSSSSLMPPPSQTASSGRLPHPKPSSPTHGRDPREEKLKQIIYKDAPKTSFGATSPKNLKKLLSLSEEGDKHIKTLRMDRSSKGDDTVASMMSSPPTSPGAKSSKRFRKLGIVNKMNNMSTGSLEPRQRRPLSPQRSDSGYGGSEAGSQSGRVEHDPRRRHTVASGPPASAFIGGGIGAYDSSDSGGGLSYDTQSNSSFGSSSPPTRDNRFVRDVPPPKLYSPPPQEMQERKPPDYEIAAARARDLPRSSESCDFYDSDNEQVSVV